MALLLEEVIRRFREKHSNDYDYSKVEYKNQYEKVLIGHNVNGEKHWFYQTPKMHWLGQGCPICFGTPKKSTDEFIKNITDKFGDIFDTSKINYVANNIKVTIGCKNHKDDYKADSNGIFWFEKTPNAFLTQVNPCPRCSSTARYDTEDFIYRANKIHNFTYLYDKIVVTNCRNKVTITCREHGDFQQSPIKHLSGQGCQKCFNSLGENAILAFLKKNNITFSQKKIYDGLIDVLPLSYDFFLPDKNILIEYNGEQHYKPVDIFGGEEQFKIQVLHDNLKKEYAEKNCIKLVVIPYWDFKNIDAILTEKIL